MDWFYKPEIIEAATKYGLATQAQYDEWLTPKAGAASTIRSGRGIEARFRSGD